MLLVAKDREDGARGSETVKVQLRSTLVSHVTHIILDFSLKISFDSLLLSDLSAVVITVCLHVSTGRLLWSVCYQRWVLWFLRLKILRKLFSQPCVMPSAFVHVLKVKKMFWSNKISVWILTM